MNNTKIMENLANSKYSNLSKFADFRKNEVIAWIPFFTKFDFLDAKETIRDLLVRYVEIKGLKPRNSMHLEMLYIGENAFTIHAITQGWNIPTHQNIDCYFNDTFEESPLEICYNIDKLVYHYSNENDVIFNKVIRVAIELRRVYFRYHTLQNELDFSKYLDNEI